MWLAWRVTVRLPATYEGKRITASMHHPAEKLPSRQAQRRLARIAPRYACEAVEAALLPCAEHELIKSWVQTHGGYIHPDLCLVEPAPCGTRGIVACNSIGLQTISEQPLILVPEGLYMTSIYAREYFNRQEGIYISDLDGAMQLAILLSHERTKGGDSFWFPYINALPRRPPCAWHMTGQELDAAMQPLQPLMPPGNDLAAAVEQARKQIQLECEIVAGAYGKRLGIDAKDLFWAKGQVLSRCFGGEDDLGLAPYIDLINHKDGAGVPDAVEVHDNVMVYINSAMRGRGRALEAGDELYIDYIHQCSPLAAFLSFGFVPPALLQNEST